MIGRHVLLLVAAGGLSAQTPRDTRPAPRYEVRAEYDVMVPMRDGVRLATDLYFPVGAGEQLPVVMSRTPYDKSGRLRNPASDAYFFAGQGFVYVAQDVRGKFASEGEYTVSAADPRDGYDALSWIARQPWSNGKIGTYGCSYLGENQMQLAKLRHPNHAAMIPQAAGGGIRFFGARTDGTFEIAAGVGWFWRNGSKKRPPPELPEPDFRKMWYTLPTKDIIKNAGGPPTDWEGFASHDEADPWWDRFGYVKATDRFDVPSLHVNSWYDYGVRETLFLFNLMRTNAESPLGRDHQYVIISPTSHCRSEVTTERTVVGTRNVGDARLDYYDIYLRWFNHWLKGVESGITDMPKVQAYVMGRNAWRTASTWPVDGVEYTKYFLHSDGRANSLRGSGTLSTSTPGVEPPDRFTYDPGDPVPTRGGPVCCTGTPDAPEGAFDQSEVERRNDVLVYTTEPLRTGLEVIGPLELVLYVESSARDTDFTGKLVDVLPDGTAYNVQEGILRARYREGFDRKVWMQQGKQYELRISLNATANYFAPGHRIRLEVSSSNFPRFDRNLNTGGNNYDETSWVIAENVVHHSTRNPSHMILPVVRE